ncbi:MAG: hypothetical protein Q9207_001404 [Kuettlingeria erythrocarpa]
MVTKESATSIGLTASADENNIPLNTDHSNLVKYKSRSQDEYSIVKEKIKKFVAQAKQDTQRRFMENDLTTDQERLWSSLNQPPYTSFRESSKIAKPEKGTLEWLVQEERTDSDFQQSKNMPDDSLCMEDFVSWQDTDKSEVLLISAPPGRGKSILSNFILGYLQSKLSPNLSFSSKIIYYFCNIRNDEASRNANSVLRALIIQLCEHQQRLFRILPIEYERNISRFFSASFDTLAYIFEKMLRAGIYTRVYCVIDGLDVYHEGMKELVSKLAEIFSYGSEVRGPVLKLFCTARPEGSILESFTTSQHRVLRCNPHDLDIVLDSRVRSLGARFTPKLRRIITDQLRRKTDNSFLWLEVVIKRIKSIGLPTKRKIEGTINDSPQELDELYYILVQGLVQKDRDNARLLACVIYAQCPLDLQALQDALAMDPKQEYTTYEQCEQDKLSLNPDEFYSTFGTLLEIAGGEVYCIHQSVKDYFERTNPLKDSMNVEPRLLLAHVSMAYLSLEDFGYSSLDRSSLFEEFPFYRYAARYWYSHIKTVADFDRHAPLQTFLKEVVFPTALKAQTWMTTHGRFRYQQPSRISEVAIQLDIGWLAELLLNRGSCGIQDDFEEDCLSQAAEQEGVVLEVLLRNERSVDFTITEGIAPRVAEYHCHATMELLLDRRGADIQITEAVVQAAAGNWGSGKEVITLLLDRRGADIQITEAVRESIAREFDQEVITLLLDQRGADKRS